MSLTKRQLLTFKKALLQFSRELCEEAEDEYLATMYHDLYQALQEEVNLLGPLAKRESQPKRATKKVSKKVKKRGPK